MKWLKKKELEKLVEKSDLIITHAGIGSIEMALEKNKKVIAVPRLKKYGEHVNDHQKDIEEKFSENGWIIGIKDVAELENAIKKSKNFIPVRYDVKHKSKIINIIKTFIDKT